MPKPAERRGGAVLLEVVLALTLFLAAAAVIAGGLNASVREVERLRLNVHASNLAVTVLSELQMGSRAVIAAGPESFAAPFEMWTWQIQTSPAGDAFGGGVQLLNVEIVVRHQSQPITRRLTQFLSGSAPSSTPETNPISPAPSGGDQPSGPQKTDPPSAP